MFKMLRAFSIFLCFWWLSSSPLILTLNISETIPIAKPGCPTACGNVTIYYPFGINVVKECAHSELYVIDCNTTHNRPKPFFHKSNIQVFDISITGQMRISNIVAVKRFQGGKIKYNLGQASTMIPTLPTVFSDTANKLTLIGCDDYVYMYGNSNHTYTSGCIAGCSKLDDVINGSCSGIGCCQTSIPKGLKWLDIDVYSFNNHTNVSYFNPYSFAFVGEQDKFTFNVADLNNPTFKERTEKNIPLVLDWYVGVSQTCVQAKANVSSYACQDNTQCTDFYGAIGYQCSCLPGYEGNPYLKPGCTDINECEHEINNCSNICTNTPGSYKCSCPKRHRGDGLKTGQGCIRESSDFVTKLTLGLGFGFLCIIISTAWICIIVIKRNNYIKMKEKFFEQNGGVLLKQQLAQKGTTMESSKIFSSNELKIATNNYSEDNILGKGGYGTVYKGNLKDGCEVAIKKSKVVDKSQVEHFINEVVILTQINHRNVVKLLGCCLETEVPVLVYEFIPNGTLFEHIHRNKGILSWLTWTTCVRLASEAADALMYLHSAASTPIIHRDIKSTNILLDKNCIAKVSDFGASRLVPIDKEQVTTLIQGTMGYLDPEYLHSSQLTEKSDVYSFGVVLAELLTKEKPISSIRRVEERNLATYFVFAMKQGRLIEILDPQLVREASEEQLRKMAKLVKDCLHVKGEDRPTMKEVALELEGLKKQYGHTWSDRNKETTNFMDQQDLYPMQLPSDGLVSTSNIELSPQYSMELSLISDINQPR